MFYIITFTTYFQHYWYFWILFWVKRSIYIRNCTLSITCYIILQVIKCKDSKRKTIRSRNYDYVISIEQYIFHSRNLSLLSIEDFVIVRRQKENKNYMHRIVLTVDRNWRIGEIGIDRIKNHSTKSINTTRGRTPGLGIRPKGVGCTGNRNPICWTF